MADRQAKLDELIQSEETLCCAHNVNSQLGFLCLYPHRVNLPAWTFVKLTGRLS